MYGGNSTMMSPAPMFFDRDGGDMNNMWPWMMLLLFGYGRGGFGLNGGAPAEAAGFTALNDQLQQTQRDLAAQALATQRDSFTNQLATQKDFCTAQATAREQYNSLSQKIADLTCDFNARFSNFESRQEIEKWKTRAEAAEAKLYLDQQAIMMRNAVKGGVCDVITFGCNPCGSQAGAAATGGGVQVPDFLKGNVPSGAKAG